MWGIPIRSHRISTGFSTGGALRGTFRDTGLVLQSSKHLAFDTSTGAGDAFVEIDAAGIYYRYIPTRDEGQRYRTCFLPMHQVMHIRFEVES